MVYEEGLKTPKVLCDCGHSILLDKNCEFLDFFDSKPYSKFDGDQIAFIVSFRKHS